MAMAVNMALMALNKVKSTAYMYDTSSLSSGNTANIYDITTSIMMYKY